MGPALAFAAGLLLTFGPVALFARRIRAGAPRLQRPAVAVLPPSLPRRGGEVERLGWSTACTRRIP